MCSIPFTKMHGLGNDYAFIDCTQQTPERLSELAIEMSDRHFGVGGDGIILITRSERADIGMRIFNADGSEAQMCGNGARCIAKYAWEKGLVKSTEMTIETLGGIRKAFLHLNGNGEVESVTIDMGRPVLDAAKIPFSGEMSPEHTSTVRAAYQHDIEIFPVSMGNPHGVVFVETPLADLPIERLGPQLEHAEVWPERANIEFVKVADDHTADMRVWERGSGETQACGTGACATTVASILSGRCHSPLTVRLHGGNLTVEWDGNPESSVMMTGPAETVMNGEYFRKN